VAISGGSREADKTWVEFDVDITPQTATNEVGDPHVFTIMMQVNDGSGLGPMPIPPNSGTVDWSFAAPDGSTTTDTCILEAGGVCTVQQTSAVAGTGTLTATSLSVHYNGTDLGPIDLTAVDSGQSPGLTVPPTAEKTWITILANVEATATNLSGDDHTFTLSAFYDDGSPAEQPANGAEFAFTWTGIGTAAPPATCTADPAENTCEVVVSSAAAGSGTITIDTVTMTVNGVTFADAVPAASTGGSLEADKTWIEFDVDITPATATNLVGDEHTFTISVRVDDGTGLVPFSPGPMETNSVAWSFAAPDGSTPTGMCMLVPGGTCTVVQTSATAGTGTLTATSLTVTYDGVLFGPIDLTAVDSGQSPALTVPPTADKTWIELFASVEPTATNPVGDAHTFTLTAQYDDGTGALKPADGAVFEYTWTGPTVTPTPSGTCTAAPTENTCEVTLTSDTPGTGTLTIDTVTVTVLGQLFTDAVPAEAAPGVLSADKTWVDWRVTVTPPSATNAVNQDHVFTLLLERNDGGGWVAETPGSIDVSWAGPAGSTITEVSAGSVDAPPTTATCDVDASGECTVTVSSPANGAGTLTATSVNVSLPGYAPPGGAPGAAFDFDVDDEAADKTWVAIRGTVAPDGVNIVGDAHQFTLSVEIQQDGSTWLPAPAGTVATFSWTGDGAVPSVDEPGPGARYMCGDCRVGDAGFGFVVVADRHLDRHQR
jgi:hypothetical protein